ncbi:glycosyltransferase, partial [bacterium]|nr:glycosyltransferase [bacterium]
DGSVDGTENMIREVMKNAPCELAYFKQENKGPGSARNAGITHAKGELILFIDDDVLPASNLLEEHVKGHQLYAGDNIAILGSVVNASEVKATHFMRWLMNEGPAFLQNREQDWAKLGHRFFCTANISLSRGFMLEKGMFDESFRPFFEDMELGYRLGQQNLQIILNKNAIGYHLREETLQKWCDRVILSGQSAAAFYNKWPAAATSLPRSTPNIRTVIGGIIIRAIPRSIIPILKPIICWLDSHGYAVPSFFYVIISHYYSQIGYKKGSKAIEK